MELAYLTALANSFVFDWLLRLRVAANITIFYIMQMPVPRLQEGDAVFSQLVQRAARLICTRPEFDRFAREVGIDPADALNDESDRLFIRAEIDAIVAHLYGITEGELRHILATFPIVPATTRDLVLTTFLRWKPPSDDPLLQLIESGESLRVEFKATARWDVRLKQVNKEMETIVVKTVAAFMNSEGGTLLIGVADDGTILGLENDYATLAKKNADSYENWLMTRLDTLGRDRMRLVRVSFRKIEGKEVCRVDIERSRRAVYVPDPQGERLYIRSGNSTRELSVSQAIDYHREHFGERVIEATAAEQSAEQPAGWPEPMTVAQEISELPKQPAAAEAQARILQPRIVEEHRESNLESHGLFRKRRGELATKEIAKPAEQKPAPIEDLTIEEILPVIRDVVSAGDAVIREDAIREIAQRLGADRLGSRIRATIEGALKTASRRSIVYSDTHGLRPLCRTIDDYKRDDLKNVLRAVIGRTWTNEEEAIRASARYLGFRRTGAQIDRAFRSAIKGGLRQALLERSGAMLRCT